MVFFKGEIVKKKNDDESETIKKKQKKKHLCYVLVTCDEPQKNGQMKVKMRYSGDPVLASMLLDNAQKIIDEDVVEGNECCEMVF